MKKRGKITLWVVGSLLMILIALLLSLNMIIRHVLTEKIDRAIANTDTLMIEYQGIDVDVFTGRMWVKGVVFQTDKFPTDSFRAFSRMEVKLVKLEGVNYKSLLYDREVDLTGLLIKGVSYKGILDTKAMAAREMADAISEEQRRQFQAVLHEVQKYLKRVTLRRLVLDDLAADVKALETGLSVEVKKGSTEWYEIGYNLRDSIPFHFNDTLTNILFNGIKVRMPDSLMNLKVSSVFTTKSNHGIVVAGIRFATDTIWRCDRDYHEVSIDSVRLDNVSIPDFKSKRSLTVEKIRIVKCEYYGCIDDTRKKKAKKKIDLDEIDFDKLGFETQEARFIAMMKKREEEMMTNQKKKMLELVQTWLDEVDVNYLGIENTGFHLKSYKTSLDVEVGNINLSFNDLEYSLKEKKPYSFNENVYNIAIGKTKVTTPDGLIKIESNGVNHKNCGPLTVGKTHVYNTVDKWRLAHIRGDVSSAWIDITLDTFYTSSFSPFHTFYKGKLKMDSVTAIVGDMYIFSDNRNLTIKEFKMPSKKALMEVKSLLNVKIIRAGVNRMKADLTGPYANPGYLTMSDAMVAFSDTMFSEITAHNFRFKFPDSDMNLNIEEIHTNNRLKGLVVKNVTFSTDDEYVAGEQYHHVDIDSVVIEGILMPNFKTKADIGASCLRIVHPVYHAYVDERPKNRRPEENHEVQLDIVERKRKEYKKAQLRNTMNILQEWLDNAQLQKIKFDDADVDVRSIHTGFSVKTTDLSLHMSGVKFNIEHYMPMHLNDSSTNFDPIKNNFKLIGKSAITYLKLRKLRATMPDSSMCLGVSKITTDVRDRSLIITGVRFATDTVIPVDEMYHDVSVDSIRLEGIILPDLQSQKEASLSNLRIINACYYGQIDEKRKKARKKETVNGFDVDEEPTDEEVRRSLKHDRTMRMLGNWFEGASLDAISIENASGKVRSISSDLDIDVKGVDLKLYDISYEIDNVKGLEYNDSIYSFGLEHADILLPDSSMVMEVNNLRNADCGPFCIGKTTIMNTVDKWEIAHTKGDVPTTWMKMVIDTVHTSDIDPVKILKTNGKVRLDSITSVIDTLYIFRDIRYKPVKPYVMPHKPIMSAPAKVGDMFSINVADATVNNMMIVLPKTDSCVMKMDMQDIHGYVYDINTKENNVITIAGDAAMWGGKAHVNMMMPLRSNYPWEVSMVARDIDMHSFDSLLYPIAGLTVGGKINEVKTIISGDSVNAMGYLSLAYEGLDIQFHKGSPTPIAFIRKNPKFLTCIARAFVSKRNPRLKGHLPLAYEAKNKNDVWQPSAMFMMGPIIRGSVYTLLPGLFVHKRVSQDKLIIKYNFKEGK